MNRRKRTHRFPAIFLIVGIRCFTICSGITPSAKRIPGQCLFQSLFQGLCPVGQGLVRLSGWKIVKAVYGTLVPFASDVHSGFFQFFRKGQCGSEQGVDCAVRDENRRHVSKVGFGERVEINRMPLIIAAVIFPEFTTHVRGQRQPGVEWGPPGRGADGFIVKRVQCKQQSDVDVLFMANFRGKSCRQISACAVFSRSGVSCRYGI